VPGPLGKAAAAFDRAPALISGDARRQRATTRESGHRPFPMRTDPWLLGQTWNDLLFAHWPVEAAPLRALVPRELELDLFDGSAWVGVTPFVVTGHRVVGTPPMPPVSSFNEVNVRTYVRHRGVPGIWFFSLDADSRAAVAGARRAYRLPYFRMRAEVERSGGVVRWQSRRADRGPAAALEVRYGPPGAPVPAPDGSLDAWLAERYCLFVRAGERVMRGDIHHPPWPLHETHAEFARNEMGAELGLSLGGEPVLHQCPRQDTLLWALTPADEVDQ
jgi:hypothetical protein